MVRSPAGPRRQSKLLPVASVLVFLAGVVAVVAAFFGPSLFGGGTDDGSDQGAAGQTTTSSSLAGAQVTLADFAAALAERNPAAVRFASSAPGIVIGDFKSITSGLEPFELSVSTGDPSLTASTEAQAPIQLTWSFPDTGAWTTSSVVQMENLDGEWFVRWAPSVLESSLQIGDQLQRKRLPSSRADILARDGSVLIGQVDLVQVGVQPSRVQDLALLVAELERLVQADPGDLSARVEAAEPEAFVEVTTLARSAYEQIREEIFPLPGTVFRESSLIQGSDPAFARAVLGRSGEVTAEIMEANPGIFAPGDTAGLSGLQAIYNEHLAGRAGVEIAVSRNVPDPLSATTGTGLTTTSALTATSGSQTLAIVEPVPGEPLVTTIDPTIQVAAERTLDSDPRLSALVAVEISTGELVAVANGPRGSTVNFAMTGQYPPGSIFKIVSGYALLTETLSATTVVECPQTITIDGRVFSNAEDEVLGPIPFNSAFAHSCNTAFVGATVDFGPETLARAAAEFGLGLETAVGAPSFMGSVPVTEGPVDLAASSFGQGRLLLSPLSAAVMAATAADGVYRSPRLITSPLPEPQLTNSLDPTAASTLRELMRQVVVDGTGRAVAGVSGLPVHGKTGTAEFGDESPPRSHAWFVGFQGNLAFAVFVEGGEFGGSTAAPLAAAFLEDLAATVEPPVEDTTTTAPTTTTSGENTTSTAPVATTVTTAPPATTTASPTETTTG